MSLVLWLHINQRITLVDPGNIQTCIHLLIKFNNYLPIHVHWCWISAAFIYNFIIQNKWFSILILAYLVFLFQKSGNIEVDLWLIFYLISILNICWGLTLLGLICIWTFVIGSLNCKLIISPWDIWVWSSDEHLKVLKLYLVLLQILEYSYVGNLKKCCNYWLIDLTAIIKNLLNIVRWYWRAACIQNLYEHSTYIKWRYWCCWLVYK